MKKFRKYMLWLFLLFFIFIFLFSLSEVVFWYFDYKDTNLIVKEILKDTEIDFVDKENLFLNVDFTNLVKENRDVSGWVYVEDTNINYPFVQTNNNSYYLNHSFDKKKNGSGWVFLDYRNSLFKDKNTILYAHGRIDGAMFGSLKKLLDYDFNKKKPIVKISTLTDNYIFEIFSIYTIKTTNDYIKTNFSSEIEFLDFIDMLQRRSIYPFSNEILPTDQIVTLSTCFNTKEKVVLHAKKTKQMTRN